MSDILGKLSRLVTVRPWVTLAVLLALTVLFASGASLREPPPELAATLPDGNPVAEALAEIEELFGESGDVRVVTLLFRGDALTPDGLAQMNALLGDIVSEPGVGELLAPADPIFAPSLLVMALLQVESFDSVTQADIDGLRGPPQLLAALDAFTGTDSDGTKVAVASVSLRDTGDEQVQEAERRVDALAKSDDGPLAVSTISYTVLEDESREATENGMGPLIGLALLLIAGFILIFWRTLTPLFLPLGGLFVALVCFLGGGGGGGPRGLGLTGPPNTLTSMVPIIVIGLTVDYAIQAVSHYREQRAEGAQVADAVQTGLRNVVIPLMLAAVTTIVSLLANLFSPVDIVGDFGIIAGMGVGMSLIVMLTLIPAGRTIIDRRRESRGTLRPARPISGALPGMERVAEFLGRQVTHRPAPYIIAVLAVTAGLGYAATDIKSEFSIRDLLPRGGSVLQDMDTLDTAVGGSTENTNLIIKAEATETRTLLNLQGLRVAFQDEAHRPPAVAGPILTSYELLVYDWVTDNGMPGDKYDPELAALYAEATAEVRLDQALMQELIDEIATRDPALSHALVNDPTGMDTILVQFAAYTGDPAASRNLQADVEELWLGDDGTITATSDSIVSFAVTDEIRDRQTESITTTVFVAVVVLAFFFWLTVRQPVLAFVAVAPTVLVLISVLGTMALLDIPYTIITSIITALSIGIGVDYTIHMIHRYREEFTRLRNPEAAAVQTLVRTGSALLGSALTTALGIGVLAASPLAASQQFGITAAITIAYSLLVSVVLVPPAMTVWGAYQNMRLRSMLMRQWDELDFTT
ncbi:MAG: MMPL family transporter [Chloroflexota bacterium]|nr:MMPL family transporter [Chloroflexota bacterium]